MSALYLLQYSPNLFHIYTPYQATSEGVLRVVFFFLFKIPKIKVGKWYKLVTLTLSRFDLGSNMNCSIVWVFMGRRWYSQNTGVLVVLVIPPASTKLKGGGGIRVSYCPPVRLSVRLWTVSCPLCFINDIRLIYFLFAHLIQLLRKVCNMYRFVQNLIMCNFGKFYKFVILTLSSFDLASNITQ